MHAFPKQLDVALKEWETVCAALREGRQLILLRKGGIHESSGGFELEHPQFLLYPTFVHQNANMLKSDLRTGVQTHAVEPARITLAGGGEVTDIIRLKYRAQMDAIDHVHIWTAPLIDMRFNYKPDNPLYLLIVRAYRLAEKITIDNTPEYAGCKSWVPLNQSIDTASVTPALDDQVFNQRRSQILSAIEK